MLFFGLSHFYKQDELVLMLPGFVPFPSAIIIITGIVEILLAAGLVFSSTRRIAGILLALYFVAVLPANVYKAINDIDVSGTMSSPILSWIRLLFQPLFILWTLYSSKTPRAERATARLLDGVSTRHSGRSVK